MISRRFSGFFGVICLLASQLSAQVTWLRSLDEAKKAAVEEKKEIFLIFTSLKVSGACVQLEKRVLSQEAFQAKAGEEFILLHLDVPLKQKPGMVDPLAGNILIAKNFGVESYPTSFYLDQGGRPFAKESGALTVGPEAYADHLLAKAAEREKREAGMKAAYSHEGIERAKAIIAILESSPDGVSLDLYAKELKEIKNSDPSDSLGFQRKRKMEAAAKKLDQDIRAIFHKNSYDKVVAMVDAFVAEHQPTGEAKQKALVPKLAALRHGNKIEEAIKAADDIIAVDPDSSRGKFAAQIKAQLKKKQ